MMKTRFEQELSGDLGEFWINSAKQELKEIKEELDQGLITIDEQGVARNRINRVLMSDMLEKLTYVTDRVDVDATKAAREKEVEESLKEYRAQMENYKPSQEELLEMRSAFGKGTTVVNCLTSQAIQL